MTLDKLEQLYKDLVLKGRSTVKIEEEEEENDG